MHKGESSCPRARIEPRNVIVLFLWPRLYRMSCLASKCSCVLEEGELANCIATNLTSVRRLNCNCINK